MVALPRPQWIAKMYPGKVGRDHLGLGSVSSDQILPSLSPSINVLTFHPRYHSFYVFLLDEFWRRDFPRSQDAWVAFFRPRDFLFSLGANMCEMPEHGLMGNIVGGQKTGPWAREAKNSYQYDEAYIKSELGGYGLYYRSVMAEVGLIYPGGPGFDLPIDVPTEYGKEVAEAFRSSISDTKYYREYFDKNNAEVPTEVIQEYIHNACLCQLKTQQAPERKYLMNSFLHNGGATASRARRETFRMFLDIAKQTQGYALDEDHFRQLIYFGSTKDGISYKPQDSVKDTYSRWRLYQAREYYAIALNAMWFYLCDWGGLVGGDIHPVSLVKVWNQIDISLDFNKLAKRFQIPGAGLSGQSGFKDLMTWLLKFNGADSETFDSACNIRSPINEQTLYEMTGDFSNQPDVMISGMIVLLTLVYIRFQNPDLHTKPEWIISRMGSDVRLSLDVFIHKLDTKLSSGPVTIMEVAQWIFENDIILQHELVATSKLPENTFRFRREGNSLRFQTLPNTLTFMSSRFDAISTTIYELGLSGDFSQPDHRLTEGGNLLLELGDING